MSEYTIPGRHKQFEVTGTLNAVLDLSLYPIGGSVGLSKATIAGVTFDSGAFYIESRGISDRITPRVWDTTLYTPWNSTTYYELGDLVSYEGINYEGLGGGYPQTWAEYTDESTGNFECEVGLEIFDPETWTLYTCIEYYTESPLSFQSSKFSPATYVATFDLTYWEEVPLGFYEIDYIVFTLSSLSSYLFKSKPAVKVYGTRLVGANGKVDNSPSYDTYTDIKEILDTPTVDFAFKAYGDSNLIITGDLFHLPAYDRLWYLGAGRSNGEVSLFGTEHIQIDDVIPEVTCKLVLDSSSVEFPSVYTNVGNNDSEMWIAGSSIYFATFISGVLNTQFVELPISSNEITDFNYGSITTNDNFRDTPSDYRTYTNVAPAAGVAVPYEGQTEVLAYENTILSEETVTCKGGLSGGWVSGYLGYYIVREMLHVTCGRYRINYSPIIANMFAEARTDLVVKGLERNVAEDEQIDVALHPLVTYGGRFDTENLGDYSDILDIGVGGFITHGGLKVQDVQNVPIDNLWPNGIWKDPNTNMNDPANWTQNANGNPSHPGWQKFPEIKFYPEYDQWMMSNLINREAISEGLPWFDDDCTITLDDLYVSNVIAFKFPVPDEDGIVTPIAPLDFTTDGWIGDSEVISSFRKFDTDISNNLFAKNIRLTGARYAVVTWKVDAESAKVTLKLGDSVKGFHSWELATPENYTSGNEIHTTIDLCYPDTTTIIDDNIMQSIVSFESPDDLSMQKPGETGIGQRQTSEKTYYDYVYPTGWGVGRIPDIELKPASNVPFYFKDIKLKWLTAEEGGVRNIMVLPHQTWVDDRTLTEGGDDCSYINSYMLPISGLVRMTGADDDFHVNVVQTFPKALVVVDGAVILEIPAGHVYVDHQPRTNPDNSPAPYPLYIMSPYTLTSEGQSKVIAYPFTEYVVKDTYGNNGCVDIEVTGSGNWNDFMKDNCYVSFLKPGIVSFFGETSVSWDFEPRVNTISIKVGSRGIGIGGLAHYQQGSIYGLSKPNAGRSLTFSSPNAASGYETDSESVAINSIGHFLSHGWNGKSTPDNKGLSINGKYYPINNRYFTRIIERADGGIKICYYFDGYRYFRAYSLRGTVNLQLYSAGEWKTFSTFGGENPSLVVYKSDLYVAHTVADKVKVSISHDLGKTFDEKEYAMIEGSFPELIKNPITMKQYLYYLFATNTIKVITSVDMGETWSEPATVLIEADNVPFGACIINYAKTIFEITYVSGGIIKRKRSYDGIEFPPTWEGETNE